MYINNKNIYNKNIYITNPINKTKIQEKNKLT